MPKLRMSDDAIRKLPIPESPVDYHDDSAGPGGTKGLLLKVSAGGARTFYCLYRPSNKKMGSRLSLADRPVPTIGPMARLDVPGPQLQCAP
jgi:hypothetical protein